MEYTLSTLINRVKAKLHDPQYDENSIIDAINETYFEVLGESVWPFLEQEHNFLTCYTYELALPTDYQATRRLIAKDKSGLHTFKYIPARLYFSDGQKGSSIEPYTYTTYGNKLYYKTPLKKGVKMEHFYIAKPITLVENDDTPKIPYEFGEVLVLGAVARCEQQRDNFDFAAIYENKYDVLVENMKRRYLTRQFDEGNKSRLPFGTKFKLYER